MPSCTPMNRSEQTVLQVAPRHPRSPPSPPDDGEFREPSGYDSANGGLAGEPPTSEHGGAGASAAKPYFS